MLKQCSRKGAKAQRINFKSIVAPLRLCGISFSVLVLLTSWIPALSQNKAARFDPDGSFWVLGQPPNELSEFGGINLNAKRSRQLPSPGLQTTNGTTYRFKTLIVKRDNLTFTTMSRAGVSYSFSGRFLKGGNFSAAEFNDEAPVLEGTLTKFRGGKKLAEAKLKFSYFGGT